MAGTRIIKNSSDLTLLREKNHNNFLKAERIGVVFVFTAAVILHFIYDWSGKETWAIMFGAVNESTWEHIKIFALPYVVWGFFELACIRVPFKGFVAAKVISLYFLMLSIPAFFYAYSTLLGENFLWIDISCGLTFTVLSFYISFSLMTKAECLEKYFGLSLFLLALYYLMFGFFTTAPPKIFLFRDPVTGCYGIPPRTN